MATSARLGRLRLKSEDARPSPDSMTLGEHLGELRSRLIVCLCAISVGAVLTYVFYATILHFLQSPFCEAVTHTSQAGHCSFYVTAPLQGFSLRLNVSAYGGIVIALPVLFYELWRFVTPGLKANERRYALPFTFATVLLFVIGAFVAYLTFPHALRFLIDVSGPSGSIRQLLSPNAYVQLIILLMVAFGVTFEFPVVLIALELAGALSTAQLSKWRRWAIIGIVVFAGVVTPSSDPFSMLALAIPLLVFYELSIVIGKMLGK